MRSSLDYPLVDRAKNPWLDELDAALLGVADRVYEAMAFDLAFVGEETSGYARAPHEPSALSKAQRPAATRYEVRVTPERFALASRKLTAQGGAIAFRSTHVRGSASSTRPPGDANGST